MTLGLMLAHRGSKLGSGNELQHLREDATYSIHDVLLWVVLDFRQKLHCNPSEPPVSPSGPSGPVQLYVRIDLPNLAVEVTSL
jgi:hypothetical protein